MFFFYSGPLVSTIEDSQCGPIGQHHVFTQHKSFHNDSYLPLISFRNMTIYATHSQLMQFNCFLAVMAREICRSVTQIFQVFGGLTVIIQLCLLCVFESWALNDVGIIPSLPVMIVELIPIWICCLFIGIYFSTTCILVKTGVLSDGILLRFVVVM